MRQRFPESLEERTHRLALLVNASGVERSRGLESSSLSALPDQETLARRIESKLAAAGGTLTPAHIGSVAAEKARQGLELADGLASGALRYDDLTRVSAANLEAVVRVSGRPCWFVRNNTPQTQETSATQEADEFWIGFIVAAGSALRKLCGQVGCVLMEVDGERTPIGTGWLIARDTLVTCAHVGKLLARHNVALPATDPRGGWRLRPDRIGFVDFAFENGAARKAPFKLSQLLYVETAEQPDIAVFKVAATEDGQVLPAPVTLDLTAARAAGWDKTAVFTVGHPLRDLQDDANVALVFGNLDSTKRISPGRVMSLLEGNTLTHDCSTTNGSSGSPLIDFASLAAVGLHYFGLPGERNEAAFLAHLADHPAIVRSQSGSWSI